MITTRSARMAIHQASAFGRQTFTRVGGGHSSSDAKVAHAIACGAVLASVERCPPPVRDWLITAYAAEGYPGIAMAARRARDALYGDYLGCYRVRASRERLFRFAAAVLCDYRAGALGAKAAGGSWYAGQVGFRTSHWPRWARTLNRMVAIINAWDRRGLAEVGAVLHRELGDA